MMFRLGCVPLLVLLGLAGCGTAHMSQEQWIKAMRDTYTPGMSMQVVEASVTRAGMTFEEERDVLRRLPRSAVDAGPGSWRRITKIENTPACEVSRTVYMRFDAADRLAAVHPGSAGCV